MFGEVQCNRKQCFACGEDGVCKILRRAFTSSRMCPFYKKASECKPFIPFAREEDIEKKVKEIQLARAAAQKYNTKTARERDYEERGVLKVIGGV